LKKRYKLSEETKQKMRDNHKDVSGENNPNYKNGLILYSTYAHQLEPYEQCRIGEDFNSLEIKCTYCGKWYMPTRIEVSNRIIGINRNGKNRFYCSDSCKQECPIYGQIKYYKGQEGHSSREVQPELRQLVLARDNYTCQKCGSDGPLHCHHIDPVVSNPIESADIDNCITLCVDCHKEAHQISGCGYAELRNCA